MHAVARLIEHGGRQYSRPTHSGVFFWRVSTPEFFLACQYMKIPADLDPPPPLEEFRPNLPPPPEEFLGPPLTHHIMHWTLMSETCENVSSTRIAQSEPTYPLLL